MTESSLLPRVTLLGEALGPVWRSLSDRIDAPVTPSSETFERREHLYRNVKVTAYIGDRLQRRFDELLDASARNENATDSDLYRAVGKLEAMLDDFVDSYHEFLALQVLPADSEWHQLIAAIYRHRLMQIHDFMREVAETLTDTALAESKIRKTDGACDLTFNLVLECPAEERRLIRLMRGERARLRREAAAADLPAAPEIDPATIPSRQPSLGFLGTLSAVLLGVGAARSLFGRHSKPDC